MKTKFTILLIALFIFFQNRASAQDGFWNEDMVGMLNEVLGISWYGDEGTVGPMNVVPIVGPSVFCVGGTATFSIDAWIYSKSYKKFVRPNYGTITIKRPDGSELKFAYAQGSDGRYTGATYPYQKFNISISTPGKYTLIYDGEYAIYDNMGNGSEVPFSGTQEIFVLPAGSATPKPTISVIGDLTGCSNTGARISLHSNFGGSYCKWYAEGSNYNVAIQPNTPGFSGESAQTLVVADNTPNINGYYYVVVSSPGCTAPASSDAIELHLKAGPVAPIITGSNYKCPNGSVTLTANALKPNLTTWYAKEIFAGWSSTYPRNPMWFNLNGTLGVTGNTYSNVAPGTYYAREVYPNGCAINSADFNVGVNYGCSYREGTENSETSDYSVSPNPSNSIVNISMPTGDLANVQIISANGIVVKEFQTSQITTEANISDLASGLYLVNINQNGVVTRKKLQVIK